MKWCEILEWSAQTSCQVLLTETSAISGIFNAFASNQELGLLTVWSRCQSTVDGDSTGNETWNGASDCIMIIDAYSLLHNTISCVYKLHRIK
jgi:hypothetical protein